MHRVKGVKIQSKVDFVREKWGEEMVGEVLGSLGDDRETVRAVLAAGWYPSTVYDRLVETIVERAACGDMAILDELGERGAESVAEGTYRVYYRSGDARTVLEKMVPIHSALNDPGEMDIQVEGPGKIKVRVREPRSSGPVCRVARAFYRRSIELCGARNVAVEEEICSFHGGPHCEFSVRWEA